VTVAFSGKVWVFGDNLNTDAMYPAFAMKVDPPEAVRPGWTDRVSPGDIVLAGKNFGLGDLLRSSAIAMRGAGSGA
jgi:3-isopropylmalate/(R)-2-methylmalate dehydratase small subunit